MYIVSGLLLGLAHYLSFLYVEAEKAADSSQPTSVFEDPEGIQRLGLNIAVQCVIGAVIAYLISIEQWMRVTLLVYTLPMLARAVNAPVTELHRVHNFSSIFTSLLIAFYIFNHVPRVLDLIKRGIQYVYLAINLYGWIPFFITVWFKILMPVQFLIFWLLLFSLQVYKYLSYIDIQRHGILSDSWFVVLFASIAECCVTPITLIGLCYTTSYVAYLILSFTKLYLQGWQGYTNDNVMHRGWTEGFTMFLLLVQTGITEMKSAQRAFLMSIVMFIVLSSLIQSMYEIADPILLQLAASQNKNVYRHIRAVLLCTVLWVVPLVMTKFICQIFEIDFWLMVIISSCVLTSLQTLGSLVVYALFMYDATRSQGWEKLDDVVYYTKATTRIFEFFVAVFVVCYGTKESLFGEWSWINTSILLVHCYFNVWQRLQAGWKAYLLRREASRRIESLPEATIAQLIELNDRCAICFQDLKSARITPCHHFFHEICLRKWFYVQDHCPMCHQKITLVQDQSEHTTSSPTGGATSHNSYGSNPQSANSDDSEHGTEHTDEELTNNEDRHEVSDDEPRTTEQHITNSSGNCSNSTPEFQESHGAASHATLS